MNDFSQTYDTCKYDFADTLNVCMYKLSNIAKDWATLTYLYIDVVLCSMHFKWRYPDFLIILFCISLFVYMCVQSSVELE